MPGMGELVVILLIVLVVFGANKLPGIGEALGRSIKNFKRSSKVEEDDDPAEDAGTDKPALAAGKSQKQLDKGTEKADDAEWEEVVVRRRKQSANDA